MNRFLGRVGELEIEVGKNLEVSDELKNQLSVLNEKHESLTKEFEKENLNSEKKIKSKERQVQELKKELQKHIEKAEKESEKNQVATISMQDMNQSSNGTSKDVDDDPPVDTNYLKHIVLRYVFGVETKVDRLLSTHRPFSSFGPSTFTRLSSYFRYITAKSEDREHLIKALSTILNFSPEDKKLISDFLEYKKSWFGVSKPTPRGSIAPSIQNSK